MARLTCLGIALAWLVATEIGCRDAAEEAATFKRCGQSTRCRSPNVCIRVGRSSEGICVYPCHEDQDCPASLRCSGAYRLSGKSGRYCRRPKVAEGGSCARIQDGCKTGLRCFKDRCVRECKTTSDCPDLATRCLQVVDTTRRGPPAKNLYRGCLKAGRTQGQSCSSKGPFCAREHICFEGLCIRVCTKDDACPKGHICDGALYRGKGAKNKRSRGSPPDIRYCRRAGSQNAACDLSKGKTCARGLACLGHRCRRLTRVAPGKSCNEGQGVFCATGALCAGGKCRKQCKVDAECPRVRRGKGRCLLRRLRGKRLGLCF